MYNKNLAEWKMAVIFSSFLGGVVVTSITGCAKPYTDSEQNGMALYKANCSLCHDEKVSGLKKEPPQLHGMFSWKTLPDGSAPVTDAAVREIIFHGRRTMPAFNGRLSEEQVVDLIQYLHRK